MLHSQCPLSHTSGHLDFKEVHLPWKRPFPYLNNCVQDMSALLLCYTVPSANAGYGESSPWGHIRAPHPWDSTCCPHAVRPLVGWIQAPYGVWWVVSLRPEFYVRIFLCFLDASLKILVFPRVSLPCNALKMGALNKLHYWEFSSSDVNRFLFFFFFGKYPLSG